MEMFIFRFFLLARLLIEGVCGQFTFTRIVVVFIFFKPAPIIYRDLVMISKQRDSTQM